MEIMNGSSIKRMRKQYENAAIKNFVRKGKIGDWKNWFNHEQSQIIDALIKVHFNGTQFKYYKDLMERKTYLIQSKL